MIRKLILISTLIISFGLTASETVKSGWPWNSDYQELLLNKAGHEMVNLVHYPTLRYPNEDYQKIVEAFPEGKILLFGYGSLMNMASASRSLSENALNSMEPVVAFGLKRIFNYKASVATRWSPEYKNEKAMLNVMPTTTFQSMVNGVVMEISVQDLIQLIKREEGYDLVPVLVASWEEAKNQNSEIQIKVAYTFLVPAEIRSGVQYIQMSYYPVRGYLQAVQEGALNFGEKFLEIFNATTFLSDGTTTIQKWDKKTFLGLLCLQEP